MKTGTLTFHGSHNYGSMLQAYALQQIMLRVFGHNEIVDLRTKRQKKMNKPLSIPTSFRGIVKIVMSLVFLPSLQKKYRLFESFSENYLTLSKKRLEKVCDKDVKRYDLLLSGSDQIWNPNPVDFDWAYYQPFSKPEFSGQKIAYAPSMGPEAAVPNVLYERIARLIKDFDNISVREVGTKKRVEEISGRNDIKVLCDPVLLLNNKDWRETFIIPGFKDKYIKSKNYIFMYTLFSDEVSSQCARELSRQMNLPVVVSSFTNVKTIIAGDFVKKYATGPIEFLNFIYHARAVVTTSFHGTAFSILFNKPFIAVNGLSDNRLSNILTLCGLTECAISDASQVNAERIGRIDFKVANENIEMQRKMGISYLEDIKRSITK